MKRLAITEFSGLREINQVEIVVSEGVFLDSIETKNTIHRLFKVFNFYVEVVFDKKGNKLKGIKTFESDDYLQPYLNKVNLEELGFFKYK